MTDINQNTSQAPVPVPPPMATNPVPIPQSASMDPSWRNLMNNLKPIFINLFNKFYSNKKIFWPVSIAFGLIFLVIILGILFGRRTSGQNMVRLQTPTPIIRSTPQATSSGNILIDSQNKLNDLKNQINGLDVTQSRLKPPTLNFDISF